MASEISMNEQTLSSPKPVKLVRTKKSYNLKKMVDKTHQVSTSSESPKVREIVEKINKSEEERVSLKLQEISTRAVRKMSGKPSASTDEIKTNELLRNRWIEEAHLASKALRKDPLSVKEQFLIGCQYYEGTESVKLSYFQAFFWISLSAESGYPPALYQLGYFYAHGIGTAKNYEEAEKWLNLAILKKNTSAIKLLSEIRKQNGKA